MRVAILDRETGKPFAGIANLRKRIILLLAQVEDEPQRMHSWERHATPAEKALEGFFSTVC